MSIIDEARAQGKWIRSRGHQPMLFHPDELEGAQSEGRFCWGDSNFELADPTHHLNHLKTKALEAQKEVDEFTAKMESFV